jgi:plastocyanin
MLGKALSALAIAGTIASASANAASVTVDVTDSKSMPAANAVVSLMPDAPPAAIASHVPEKSIIDQRHETFLPLVVVVRKGGSVTFTNNDVTTHQVYSFSPVKQFQFEISKGQISKPVVFDTAGAAAIGCNIHDNMVAFVYVTEAPFAAVTDASGHTEFHDVPEGIYRAIVWHPQLRVGKQPPSEVVTVHGNSARLAFSVPITAGGMPGMRHMHKSDY